MKRLGLIIDDDMPSRKIYGGMLARLGLEVEEIADGDDAKALLPLRQPEIIILDLLLPHVNGLELLEYIYSAPHMANTRVIIISAHTVYRQEVDLRPGDAYFIKPIPPAEVREYLVRLFAESQP